MTQSCDDATDKDSMDEGSIDVELKPGIVLTRLSEMVRKKYCTYLENLLNENYKAWCLNEGYITPREIQKCVEILEEKAIKACIMVQFYRKAMIKIIANIRKNTNECILQSQLKSLIEQRSVQCNKCTQTEETLNVNESAAKSNSDEFTTTLQEKINNFQQKLVDGIKSNKKTDRMSFENHVKRKRLLSPDNRKKQKYKERRKKLSHSLPSPTCESTCISSPALVSPPPTIPKEVVCVVEKEPEDDNVAKELAQLFSEERTEIDEIFGFDANEPPDDPQIDNILKEISLSKLSHERKIDNCKATPVNVPLQSNKAVKCSVAPAPTTMETAVANPDYDSILRDSLWPCEMHMQKEKLSSILARLLDEDLRWHEVIQWKFVKYFGDDSDDEFAVYSPSIELNDVIISSCMKRIAPWMVKHLMQPMNDGLIGNRFLFKKLAKRLSRNIIIQNQYPDEKLIKEAVEDFFCLHQCVMSLADLENIN